MLIYHPAIDFYHCWMRFAAVLWESGSNGIELERIRIIDFLLCFPQEIGACKLPSGQSSKLRSQIKQLPKSYEDPNSLKQGFAQMSKIQEQVAMDMVAKGIVLKDRYREGILMPSAQSFANELLQSVAQKWEIRSAEWYSLAVSVLLSIPLNGKDGLKARSGLLEFRYDG